MVGTVNVLMGHNRWATQGAVNSVNAHPFQINDIYGAHNGTLRAQWRLEDHHDFEVDSENIFHHIDKMGVEDLWANVDGAAALTWWDEDKKMFHFLRNSERPLYYVFDENSKAMYYASEKGMLSLALDRNSVKYGEINEVATDTLYSFPVLLKNFYLATDKQAVPRLRKVAPFVRPKSVSVNYGANVSYRSNWNKNKVGGNSVVGKSTALTQKSTTQSNVVNITGPSTAATTTTDGSQRVTGKDLALVTPYIGTKQNCILVDVAFNSQNAAYLFLFVDAEPDIEVRIHINNNAAALRIKALFDKLPLGMEMVLDGRISRAAMCPVTGVYVVMSPNDAEVVGERKIKIITKVEEKEVKEVEPKADADFPEETTPTFLGAETNRLDFDRMYLDCDWCGGLLMFEDNEIRFTSLDSAVCGDCTDQLKSHPSDILGEMK